MSTGFTCQSCAGPLELTPQYIALYGGQVSNCPTCGAAFTIPLPQPAIHVGTPPVMSYAGPQRHRYGGSMWAEGPELVCYQTAVGPDRCVKCDAPADGWRWKRALYWHHPAYFLMILFPGLLIYAIVALCVRKRVQVSVGLCKAHRAVRLRAILVGWLGSLLAAPGLIGMGIYLTNRSNSGDPMGGLLIVLGIAVFLFSILWAGFRAPPLRVKRVTERYAYLAGARTPFLANLDRP